MVGSDKSGEGLRQPRSFDEAGVDLAFDELSVRPIGPGVALVLGRYTLYEPGFENQPISAQGYFTLVLRKEADGRWRIIHDHSS